MKIIVRKGPPTAEGTMPTVVELWMDEEEACNLRLQEPHCAAVEAALQEHLSTPKRWRVNRRIRLGGP